MTGRWTDWTGLSVDLEQSRPQLSHRLTLKTNEFICPFDAVGNAAKGGDVEMWIK